MTGVRPVCNGREALDSGGAPKTLAEWAVARRANMQKCRLRHEPRRFVLAARLTGGRIFGPVRAEYVLQLGTADTIPHG